MSKLFQANSATLETQIVQHVCDKMRASCGLGGCSSSSSSAPSDSGKCQHVLVRKDDCSGFTAKFVGAAEVTEKTFEYLEPAVHWILSKQCEAED